MKSFKKVISILLCAVLLMQLGAVCLSAGAANANYKIVSPYEDVIWSGSDAWGAYKGTIHSHTTYSDAEVTLSDMVKEYYNQDYDFLANADHGITGVEWNKEPQKQLLYSYQPLLGYKFEHLTDEEFAGITSGTYPLYDGTVRNKKMVCVVGANELNNLSLSKNHVNGFFLPADKANGFGGLENELGFDVALKYIDENGGLSHINHPGDWIESNSNPDAVNDPENIAMLGNLILKYDSCLGTEVFNEKNGTTGYDRILWDNLLMYCLPYGKNVIGFSNTDAHEIKTVDSSFSIFMMKENNVENIKETMQSGAFFSVTRKLRGNDFAIGPKEGFDVMNKGLPYPMFTELTVNGHKVDVSAKDCTSVKWIADGKVIAEHKADEGKTALDYTLDLDNINGADEFQYIRAELYGEGGMCISQALVIDNGTAPLEYEEETNILQTLLYAIRCTKVWTIANELIRAIKNA